MMDEPQTGNRHTEEKIRVTIIGAGTIGLSFAALHLSQRPNAEITIYDTRPDLESYIYENLWGEFRNPRLYFKADRV
jgi:cation diffusion facilitator CzcD-associated flavoprotein CzcO